MTAKKSGSSRRRSRPAEPKKANQNVKIIAILAVIAIVIIIAVAVFYIRSNTDGNQNNGNTAEGNPIAVIDTSMGTIKVELYKDKVPNTCDNFVKLANDGFYDGLVFHRVMNEFMIQSGGFEPDGSQKQSPYGTIDLEINSEVRHVDGAIAMARQGQDMTDPTYFNTATSQFYICDGAQHGLDDYYAVFGKVMEGIDVIQSIANVETTIKNSMGNWPIDDVIINSIIIES